MSAPPAEEVVLDRTGEVVLPDLQRAKGVWGNFRGLMFKKTIPAGYGLLFAPAQGIHTQFMRFPIDLIFLDEADRVTKVHAAIPPWRFDFTRAAAVIECLPGTAKTQDIRVGDQLTIRVPSTD